jgi:hypothetical protein
MPRMIELIRSSAVPATLMQAAARGALSVPPDEIIEILVHLANHNKVFGQLARMTLAGWDEKSSVALASNPKAPQEVLAYWTASENLRPRLLPALLENPAIAESTLMRMAATGSREVVEAMQNSARVKQLPNVVRALASNPNSTESESVELQSHGDAAETTAKLADSTSAAAEQDLKGSPETGDPYDEALNAFLAEHAKELAADEGKPFQPVGGIYEFERSDPEAPAAVENHSSEPVAAVAETAPQKTEGSTAAAAKAAPAAPTRPAAKKPHSAHDDERGSALQKIAKLDVKGRIQLAMKGTKEDRSILIRDGTKLVALAVLESGKITDGEVEKFAAQKNVLEAVLRQIPMKRRFAKNYNVVRNLVANPRTPLDVSLGLMKNILVADLRHLSANKDVPETIRKLALKMFKQKTDTSRKSG